MTVIGDFLLFSGRSGKPQCTQRDAEKNNNPLRSSASSAVNLFCHDPLIQNKLKSLEETRNIYMDDNADGSDKRLLTTVTTGFIERMVWSPDG